ncbi:glycoside hydrolase family 38 C-terminal domain-containing protein [Dysgonomonas sp. 25]|uniref:glycoside hydrolase family 38 C-terminal domain-containing protein n=1 Tax=Dysgonomonas sp. 25 TaxID=2302933 RepID=UPI0013D291A6|nr:glycoside hydrolase family 38 C-terminal domain-containing protein [Dysgonomonas sp. 25]NDV67977.1 alpha-mannosidase [Dysgonomonas sp. 25]
MRKVVLFVILGMLLLSPVRAQQAYFADGYHGGIYGHYPMWNTQFMVDKLAQHPEWRIGLEIEPETWDTVMVKEPEAYRNFKAIAGSRRIDWTNPTYAQPYCFNISGESIIRQFQYGMKKVNQHFPDVRFTTYSAEEPCFTSALPQILQQLGFKYAVLKNPDTCWGGYTRAYGGELVNWVGPDGTAMLTVPRYACEEPEENSTWQTKAWNNSSSYLDACFAYGIKNPVGMCYQDAGWKNGPWIGHGDNIHNNSQYVTWTGYIEHISVGQTDDNWRVSQEDMQVSLMWGSQILQRIAQEVRASENNIVTAEKIAAMANIENGYRQPQTEIDEAWRTLMMAQHHDSWIVPYNRLKENRTWAEEITRWTGNTDAIANKIVEEAACSFGSATNNKPLYVRVFNTTGTERDEVVSVELPAGIAANNVAIYNANNEKVESYSDKTIKRRLIFRVKVPSFGYSTYRIGWAESESNYRSGISFDSDGNCIMQNDMYKLIVDRSKGGVIKSLVAKQLGNKEFADAGNSFALGEIRGFFYEEGNFRTSVEAPVKITVLNDNPLETSIRIEGEIASHPYSQVITLKAGQRNIDFRLNIDWKDNVGIGEYRQQDNWRENRRAFYDDRYKLSVLFPTRLSNPQLYKDAPFDVCESRLDNTFYNTWDNIKHTIILHWVDLAEKENDYGLALFSDHTTTYSYGEDFPLALTAQYSGKGLWGPDYKITRPLEMKYALVPHRGKWDEASVSAENANWNERLITTLGNTLPMEDKSFIDIESTGYEITAVTESEGDILIRLFNAEGDDGLKQIRFNFPIAKVEEVDLNGRLLSVPKIEKNQLALSMPRFGLRTLRIKKSNI